MAMIEQEITIISGRDRQKIVDISIIFGTMFVSTLLLYSKKEG